MYSPTRKASSIRKKMPEITSRTRLCAPKPIAMPTTPSPARSGPTFRPSVARAAMIATTRRLAHHFVDLVSIRPDEYAPAIGLDTVEDDRRGLCRAGQRLVTKTPLELGHEVTQLIVR